MGPPGKKRQLRRMKTIRIVRMGISESNEPLTIGRTSRCSSPSRSRAGRRSHPEVGHGALRRRWCEWERPHTISWRSASADDAEWMFGKSRYRLAPVLTKGFLMDVRPERVTLRHGPQLDFERVRCCDHRHKCAATERVATKVVRVRDGDCSPCRRGEDKATPPTKESSASCSTAFR